MGPHNVYLQPGSRSLEGMINETQNGVFINKLQGIYFGINIVSGNIWDAMNNIDEIASDLIINNSVTAPSIKVKWLSISGM